MAFEQLSSDSTNETRISSDAIRLSNDLSAELRQALFSVLEARAKEIGTPPLITGQMVVDLRSEMGPLMTNNA